MTWVTGGGEFRRLAVPMPDATANPMSMLEVFDPTGASLELILGDPECFSDIPSLITD